jgi:acetate kinase
MNVLVLNCGSSTVKFQLISTDLAEIERNADRKLARGVIERVGGEAVIKLQADDGSARRTTAHLRDIRAAVDYVLRWLSSTESGVGEVSTLADIHAVGHRVVHGGERGDVVHRRAHHRRSAARHRGVH